MLNLLNTMKKEEKKIYKILDPNRNRIDEYIIAKSTQDAFAKLSKISKNEPGLGLREVKIHK